MHLDKGKWWFSVNWGPGYYAGVNFTEKTYRYWGPDHTWYDGPIYSYGFWYFNIFWNYQIPGHNVKFFD